MGFHSCLEVGERVRDRDNRHRDLVVESFLRCVKTGLEVEDRLTVLDGHDPSGGETLSVANAIHVVEDRRCRVTRSQEVGVKGVDAPVSIIHGAGGCNESLSGDLSAEDPLAIFLGRAATKDVDFDDLQIEERDQIVEGMSHWTILAHRPCIRPEGPSSWVSAGRVPLDGLARVTDMTLLSLNPDQLLSTTRAVRKRLDFERPVPDELIRECVALAMQSPSGSNDLTMQFVIVTEPDKRRAVGEIYKQCYAMYQQMDGVYIRSIDKGDSVANAQQQRSADSADFLGERMGEAPALVLACTVGMRTEATAGMGMMVSSMMGNILPAMWSFMLAARARGLGTSWTTVHLMMEQQVADILGIPFDTVQQVCLSPLAFTKGTDFKPASRPEPDSVIHWNGW